MTEPNAESDAKSSPTVHPLLFGIFFGVLIGFVTGYLFGGLLPTARATFECSAATDQYLAVLSQQLDAGDVEGVALELQSLRDHPMASQDPAQFTMLLDASADRLLHSE
jgi:hypothetical protein